MKRFLLIIALSVLLDHVQAQEVFRTIPATGNKKATVSEWVGITTVEISYNRPAVKGREGKIWGQVVHYGFADLDYGTSKAAPWRAGANENTTISFSTDVYVEGKPLAKGKYGFFVAMGKEKATLVFSKHNTAWGSFYYNPKDDALRVDVPVIQTSESVEWLKYEFTEQTANSAVVALQWEKVKIPFKVSVDLEKEQIAEYRRAIYAGEFYRYWQNMQQAANYCLVNDMNIDEGLEWAKMSVEHYFGEANFLTLSTYAGLLRKKGNIQKADSLMSVALPKATFNQLFSYALNLARQKKFQESFEAFKMNHTKFPNNPDAILGMAYGYAAISNFKEAIKMAEKAKAMYPDSNSKAYVDKLITDIQANKVQF